MILLLHSTEAYRSPDNGAGRALDTESYRAPRTFSIMLVPRIRWFLPVDRQLFYCEAYVSSASWRQR